MTNWLVRTFVKNYENTKSPAVHTAYGKMAGGVGIICNLLLAAGKLLVGLFSGSLAIMADAVNNLSDAAASVITLVGFKLAAKPADEEHPFGHARFEYIAGLAVAVLVLVIGLELAKGSIEKIITPTPVDFGTLSLVVLAVSVAAKLWMAAFNRNIGRRIGSSTLEATFADSRNDAISTFAVLVAALVARFTGVALDGWIGLGVSLFILYSGIGIVKETLNPLLGQAPSPQLVEYVREKISGYEGVMGTHDLMVHDYGPGRRFASAHVEMPAEMDPLKAHDIIDNIELDFLKADGIHIVLHFDPIITGDEAVNDARAWVAKQVRSIDEHLTIHDLRVVDGPSHINYVFDVVVPPRFKLSEEDLKKQIQKAVQRGEKPIRTVITVDQSYAPVHV